MTDRCDRAEPTAMRLIAATHYYNAATVASVLRDADLPALVIWLARACDPTKSADELQSWTDPDAASADPRPCGQPSWRASYDRHRQRGEDCDTCAEQMKAQWRQKKTA